MAEIKTYLRMKDEMTPVLNKASVEALKLANTGNKLTNTFHNLGVMTNKQFDMMHNAVTIANRSIDDMANSANMASDSIDEIAQSNNRLKDSFMGIKNFFFGNLLANALERVLGIIHGAIMKTIQLSDTMTGIKSRLEMIGGSAQNAVALNGMIYESAQRARGSYLDMAEAVNQVAMNAKDAFPDPREAIRFMEGIQKMFVVGGASKENQKFAMLQLTQALASGRLQGDEFRSISENAPIIQNYIAKSLGVSRGALKELATQGLITSDVIKSAIFDNIDDINAQFEKSPKRWGDLLISFKNQVIQVFTPIITYLSNIANNPYMKELIDVAVSILHAVSPLILAAIKGIGAVIEGIATGIIGIANVFRNHAWLSYGIIMLITGALTILAYNKAVAVAATIAHIASLAMEAITTAQVTLAQWALNSALLACPVTWVVGGIMLIISVIYGAISVFNKWKGTSLTVFGVIGYGIGWLVGAIYNYIGFLWNVCLDFAEFIVNVFNNPLDAVYNLFVNIWTSIVDVVEMAVNSVINLMKNTPLLNKVFTNLQEIRVARPQLRDYVGRINLQGYKVQGRSNSEFAEYGMRIGDGLHQKIADFMNPKSMEAVYTPMDEHGKQTAENTKNTADHTGRIADNIEMTSEEIKALRESALQQAMQEFHNQHVIVEIANTNTISNDVDIDGMTTQLVKGIKDAIQMRREGVAL